MPGLVPTAENIEVKTKSKVKIIFSILQYEEALYT
jgi:hypothetical protein